MISMMLAVAMIYQLSYQGNLELVTLRVHNIPVNDEFLKDQIFELFP